MIRSTQTTNNDVKIKLDPRIFVENFIKTTIEKLNNNYKKDNEITDENTYLVIKTIEKIKKINSNNKEECIKIIKKILDELFIEQITNKWKTHDEIMIMYNNLNIILEHNFTNKTSLIKTINDFLNDNNIGNNIDAVNNAIKKINNIKNDVIYLTFITKYSKSEKYASIIVDNINNILEKLWKTNGERDYVNTKIKTLVDIRCNCKKCKRKLRIRTRFSNCLTPAKGCIIKNELTKFNSNNKIEAIEENGKRELFEETGISIKFKKNKEISLEFNSCVFNTNYDIYSGASTSSGTNKKDNNYYIDINMDHDMFSKFSDSVSKNQKYFYDIFCSNGEISELHIDDSYKNYIDYDDNKMYKKIDITDNADDRILI